jgi:hypothetical protein
MSFERLFLEGESMVFATFGIEHMLILHVVKHRLFSSERVEDDYVADLFAFSV